MDFLTKKLQDLGKILFVEKKEQKREISKYDVYFDHIYKILSWEDNSLTLAIFLVINFIFWIIVYWQVKFFCVVFLIILIGFLWDTYFESKEFATYQSEYLELLDDICVNFRNVVLSLRALRRESPSTFCLGMSLMFLVISFAARNVSGYVLLYFVILGIFFIPLGFKHLPEEYISSLKQALRTINSSKGVLAEDELIPFIFNKDFGKRDNDLDSLLTDKTADSATNSLASGISFMPSYLDITESRDGIEEEDLIPNRLSQQRDSSRTPFDLSSDSDSEHRDIHFNSAHFNGDSSSEEENQLGSGLHFTADVLDSTQQSKAARDVGYGVLSNFAAMGSNLMANVLKSTATTSVERKSSSSDSEFEIINSDEVENS